jgi:hypothetical protein
VLPSQLAIAVFPHLIPATTIPNGDLERALSEPLADARDEVIYLVCSHPRVLLARQEVDGSYPVLLADGRAGATIDWSASSWWARITLPSHATPSRVPWAIIDDALESEEKLPPIDVDLRDDPDGERAQNRQELLPWIYDRHLELTAPPRVPRGTVDGGRIDLRLEYVGSSGRDALRRPAGAHHKVPTILGKILLYEPHRILYLMACDVRFAFFDNPHPKDLIPALRIAEAVTEHGVERQLLIGAAEDALIAAAGAPYNKRNTGRRRFPASVAGDRLAQLGVRRVMLNFWGLPERVRLTTDAVAWDRDTVAKAFSLGRDVATS